MGQRRAASTIARRWRVCVREFISGDYLFVQGDRSLHPTLQRSSWRPVPVSQLPIEVLKDMRLGKTAHSPFHVAQQAFEPVLLSIAANTQRGKNSSHISIRSPSQGVAEGHCHVKVLRAVCPDPASQRCGVCR